MASTRKVATKKRVNPLRPGDVLLTHPHPGFWGCAVVLTARDQTPDMYPASHIGIMTLVAREPITWQGLDPSSLELLRFTVSVRVGPDDYRQETSPRTCIGIHTVAKADGLVVLGRVDPARLWPHALTFAIGDGTGRRFPLCGPIDETLGIEAVQQWRSVHDVEAMAREVEESRAFFERFEAERLAAERAARASRKAKATKS